MTMDHFWPILGGIKVQFMKILILCVLTLLASAVMAQPPAVTSSYLIKAGKFFDSETGEFKTGMVILVKDKKIEAIRTAQELSEAEKAGRQVVDLSAYAVLPGLIDCHTHLLYREVLHPGNSVGSMDLIKELTTGGEALRAIY